VENQVDGQKGEMETPAKIREAMKTQMNETLTKNNIKLSPDFRRVFEKETTDRVGLVSKSGGPVTKEAVARGVQTAFTEALRKTGAVLSAPQKEVILRELRNKASSVSIAKEAVPWAIEANIRTADVKEVSSGTSVVRLKVTFKEEGLEWATQASDSGGVTRTLQPE
jgi:hypothetical protein